MPNWHEVSVWEQLAQSPEAQVAAAAVDSRDAASVARLRKRFDADLVSAALELADARRKAGSGASGKFARGAELWCDVQGIEQASGDLVARWKAQRMREVLGAGAEISDICCGIGGDAMALAAAGLRVTAVDLDARRAWMAGRNAGCASVVADAQSLDLNGIALHADPARRDERGGTRSWNIDDHQPGRAWMECALAQARAVAIKFAPGVDRRTFGAVSIEWEFIESRGTLVQAVAWSGAFARDAGKTRATLIDARRAASPSSVSPSSTSPPSASPSSTSSTSPAHDDAPSVHTIVGIPDDARADRLGAFRDPRPGAFLCEPAAALERAQLLTEAAIGYDACEVTRGLGLVESPTPLAAPWFESFEIVCESKVRVEAFAAAMRAHGLTPRSVRVRGDAAEANVLTRALGCNPKGDGVVFIWRHGKSARAFVTRVR